MAKSNKCPCCDGSGNETDNVKLGRALSGHRLRAGIKLRKFAELMDLSHSYLCQLEKGRRRWSPEMVNRYRGALALTGAFRGPLQIGGRHD